MSLFRQSINTLLMTTEN